MGTKYLHLAGLLTSPEYLDPSLPADFNAPKAFIHELHDQYAHHNTNSYDYGDVTFFAAAWLDPDLGNTLSDLVSKDLQPHGPGPLHVTPALSDSQYGHPSVETPQAWKSQQIGSDHQPDLQSTSITDFGKPVPVATKRPED